MSKLLNLSALLILFTLLVSPIAMAEQLQLVKVSDLQKGDTFIDPSSGEEITVQTKEASDYNFLTNLKDILTGKNILTGMVTGNNFAPITGRATETFVLDGFEFTKTAAGTWTDGVATYTQSQVNTMVANSQITLGSTTAASTSATTATTTTGSSSLLNPSSWFTESFTYTTEGGVTSVTSTSATASLGNTLSTGLMWAGIAYMAGQLIGSVLGMDAQQTDSLSTALAAGAGTYGVLASDGFAALAPQAAQSLTTSFWTTGGALFTPAALIGVGIAVIVFLATYEDAEYREVSFSCQPFQAPSGGNDCEVCNDGDLPCSEYRCKSLGQACELVNQGSEEERCVYAHPNDATPPVITPNQDLFTEGYTFDENSPNSPPGPGFVIEYDSSDGCVPAFTPFEFGITTDEPSQCSIDFEQKDSLDEMKYLMGNSNFMRYNHTERFSLPGPDNLERQNITLENGGIWDFFIRCKDVNGNENVAEYAVRFCVDPAPDTTAPTVIATSIKDEGCVAEDRDPAPVTFYINEPGQCRWSTTNQNFNDMPNLMVCSDSLEQMNSQQLYPCQTELSGIAREGSNYYIRCQDIAEDPNEMSTSFEFSLRSSNALLIKKTKPNETIFGVLDPTPVELYAETAFGCNENRAVCAYSFSGDEDDYELFIDTDNEDGISTTPLRLTEGRKEIFIRCADEGGNVAIEKLDFRVEIDKNAPMITRVYEEADMLKILTMRDSVCTYTNEDCNFLIEEGTEMPYSNSVAHVTEWNKDETYYIKCRDDLRPEEPTCSIIVKPTDNFL